MKAGLLTTLLSCATLTISAQEPVTPMTLKGCIDYAQQHNINLQRVRLAQQQRALSLNSAKNNRLPVLDGSVSQSFNFGRGLNASNTYVSQNTRTTNFHVGTSLPLFTGHRISSEIATAQHNLAAAMADLSKASEDLSINIAHAFLQVLTQEELVQVAKAQVAISKEQKVRFDSLLAVGRIAEYDVIQAQAQIAQDELALVQAQNGHRLALLDLSQMLELPSPDALTVSAPYSDVPQDITGAPELIFQEAVGTKPAVMAEQSRLNSTKSQIKTARAGYYPTVSLTAGMGTSYYHVGGFDNTAFGRQLDRNLSKSVGLSVSIPIFDRFATRNAIRQAKVAHADQMLQLEMTKKELYKEIQQAYYNAIAARAKYEAGRVAEELAEEAFRLAAKKYEYGKGHLTEYNEAKTKWEKARIETVQAKYDYIFRHKILDFYKGKPIE